MKKFFIAICFNLLLVSNSSALITPLGSYTGSLQQSPKDKSDKVKVVSYEEFTDLVRESVLKAPKMPLSSVQNKNSSVIVSPDQQKASKENAKGIFEKIYDEAMKRVSDNNINNRADIAVNAAVPVRTITEQEQQWRQSGLPTITVKMPPTYAPTAVLAMEHVPYYLSELELLNNGMVKITETIMVIANGKKLQKGLTKILPLRIPDGKGKKQTLDYTIISVSRNDVPVNYNMVGTKENILLVPDDDEPLAPGVYTYRFEFLVDNLLIDKGNNYILYWNVGGNGWNLVVDRLGALLTLPRRDNLLQHNVLFGQEDNLHAGAVIVKPSGLNSMFYNARKPLFVGEGMYLLTIISKDAVLPPSLWQKLIRKFYDFGDIILAFICCLFISVSLLLSWRYIKANKKIKKITINKTAAVLRYLFKDKFDMTSVGGFLLDIYKKNIIDIQKSDDTILLIKRTDNLSMLQKYEQEAIKKLFPSHETIFNVIKNNRLIFSRFTKKLKQGVNAQISRFNFKINFGYALINLAMLLLTAAFIAYFKISFVRTFTTLAAALIVCWAVLLSWKASLPVWLKIIWRFLIIDICIIGCFIMSMVIHPWAAIILILSEIILTIALYFYGRRYGLMSYYINDVNNYRNNILKNVDNITLGKNFLNYQAAVFALELDKEVKPIKEEEYYKIPIVQDIIKIMKQ